MLDLDALTQLDDALNESSDRPLVRRPAKAPEVKSPAAVCPHLARIAAE